MKRSKLCTGFLTLFVPVVLSCLMFSDTSALKHEYQGLSLLHPAIPALKHDSNNYIDWNNSTENFDVFSSQPFFLSFQGNSWDNSLSNLRVRKALRYLQFYYDSSTDKCTSVVDISYGSKGLQSIYSNLHGQDGTGIDSSYPNIFADSFNGQVSIKPDYYDRAPYFYIPDYYQGNKLCHSRSGMSSINYDSFDFIFNSGLSSWPNENEPLIYNPLTVANNDHIFPYYYYTDTLPFKDSHRQSDGVVYTKSFSFDTIFNQKITSFSNLTLNFDEYGGYWYDDNNLWSGRSIDFHYLFRFENSFTLENTFINGGSLQLAAKAVPKLYNPNNNNRQRVNLSYNCTSTVRQVGENDYYWDIDCPVTLDQDYIIFVPSLEIDGNGNRVFTTDGNWEFSSVYIVTDHDSTPGRDFNDSPTGNTNIWDAYWSDNNNQANPGDADWLQTLASLFSFDFFNPFAPIFQMFSDNNSCAQIPVLAGMIHSEETQVCPWFDSTTRNIVTPVLGLASMMLVFGFAVRWLGSSSGNMFEDSGQHDISSNSTLRSKWRKK